MVEPSKSLFGRIKNMHVKRIIVLIISAVFSGCIGVVLELAGFESKFCTGFSVFTFLVMVLLADQLTKTPECTNENKENNV